MSATKGPCTMPLFILLFFFIFTIFQVKAFSIFINFRFLLFYFDSQFFALIIFFQLFVITIFLNSSLTISNLILKQNY